MLKIKNLKAAIASNDILDGVNLSVNEGETHIIYGKNGSGKSTLIKAIMKHYLIEQKNGEIIFNGEDLGAMTTSEIARKGIFVAMQNIFEIQGITNYEFIKILREEHGLKDELSMLKEIKKYEEIIDKVGLDKKDIPLRDLNVGMSGGEKKKNELTQALMLMPKLYLFDEIDSGLDIEAIKNIANEINKIKQEQPKSAFLIITHSEHFLKMLNPDYIHIFKDGKIKESSEKINELIAKIGKEGF